MQKKFSNLYLLETEKEGLGNAYLKGFKYCEEKINPYLVIQIDADGQHNPDKIPEFIKKIEQGADFVVGTRYSKGGSIPANWGLHRKILSIGANSVVKFGFMKLKVTEWTNGFRAIKFWLIKNAYDHLKNYSGYVFQVAFLDFAIKNNAVLGEIPIHFKERTTGISKINAFQYSFQTLLYVFKNSSFIKFVIVGFIGFTVDFSFAYLFINQFHLNKPSANMFSAEIAIISNFLMNNFWSFKDKKIAGGFFVYLIKFITFNFVSSGSIIIQGIGLSLALRFLGDKTIHLFEVANIESWIIYKVLIITLVIIPYSYILYNKLIWKKK
ncbi:Dolichyl-phosphate beta-D-mannosyltransferase [Candidatus Roizmanbacteria bacterium]|nr:Dolichyl-phosphate beta-D-mannosyltransferase [Candidatus Roizmanbacteria bacterium]